MKHFNDVVLDQFGKGVAAASFYVYTDAGYSVLAALFSDDGITPTANPTATGALGVVDFYVADGRYYFRLVKAGYTTQQIGGIEVVDVTEQATTDAVWSVKAIARGVNAVAFSATPVFDASLGDIQTITLTAAVTSSTFVNATTGQMVTFDVVQDGTGSRAFAWPANVKGDVIGTAASSHNLQTFYWNGTNAYPIGPLVSVV